MYLYLKLYLILMLSLEITKGYVFGLYLQIQTNNIQNCITNQRQSIVSNSLNGSRGKTMFFIHKKPTHATGIATDIVMYT